MHICDEQKPAAKSNGDVLMEMHFWAHVEDLSYAGRMSVGEGST